MDDNDTKCITKNGMVAFLNNIQSRIDSGGWFVMASAVDTPFDGAAPYVPIAYTVGLMAKGLPELVVYGLPNSTACSILNEAAELLIKDELKLDVPNLVLSNHPLMFKQVEQDLIEGVFGLVRRFSTDGTTAKLWQLVWADAQDLFPWDAGFDESMRHASLVHYRLPHELN
jgi:hypothetical protein